MVGTYTGSLRGVRSWVKGPQSDFWVLSHGVDLALGSEGPRCALLPHTGPASLRNLTPGSRGEVEEVAFYQCALWESGPTNEILSVDSGRPAKWG